MKSRKQYAGMLIGFVSVGSDRAKCTLVTAVEFNLVHANPHSVPENVTGAFEPGWHPRN
jgi:hypothetical protein